MSGYPRGRGAERQQETSLSCIIHSQARSRGGIDDIGGELRQRASSSSASRWSAGPSRRGTWHVQAVIRI